VNDVNRRLDDHDDAIEALRKQQGLQGDDILVLKTTARVVWIALPAVFSLVGLVVMLVTK